MFTLPRVPRLAALSAIAAAFALCAPAHAMDIDVKVGPEVKVPSGLKWQKVSVTSKNKKSQNFGQLDSQTQDMLYNLWAEAVAEKRQEELRQKKILEKSNKKKYMERLEDGKKHDYDPFDYEENIHFVEFALNGAVHRFSAFNAPSSSYGFNPVSGIGGAYSGCRSGELSETICKWRYDNVDLSTGKIIFSKTFEMCAYEDMYTGGGHANGELVIATDFAVDDKTSTVYFKPRFPEGEQSYYHLIELCPAAIRIK